VTHIGGPPVLIEARGYPAHVPRASDRWGDGGSGLGAALLDHAYPQER
jgi:hypothetical protein